MVIENKIAKQAIDRQLGEKLPENLRRPLFGDLDESGLSRVWKLTKEPFAVITAFRSNYDRKQNLSRNRQLLATLNSMRMGPHLLIGHWAEAADGYTVDTKGGELVLLGPDGAVISADDAASQQLLTDAIEDSYFVPKPVDMDLEAFKELMTQAIRKYDQDAAVFGDGSAIHLLFQSGKLQSIGSSTTFNKVAQAYSQLRKRPGVPFVFEGTAEPINVMSRMAFNEVGLRWTLKT